MGFMRDLLWGALKGITATGSTRLDDNEAYADIEYLDQNAQGNWKFGGRVINYGSQIRDRMQQVKREKEGRRVRAVDMNTRHIIDIIN